MNAGTDANVWIKLFGDAGDSGDLKLSKSETNVNKFERNNEDVFVLKAPYIGKVTFQRHTEHINNLYRVNNKILNLLFNMFE